MNWNGDEAYLCVGVRERERFHHQQQQQSTSMIYTAANMTQSMLLCLIHTDARLCKNDELNLTAAAAIESLYNRFSSKTSHVVPIIMIRIRLSSLGKVIKVNGEDNGCGE